MKTKQLFLILAAFAFVFTANAQTWDCGSNPTTSGAEYTSDVKAVLENDTLLRIFGEGDMADFTGEIPRPPENLVDAPWNPDYTYQITEIVIENGVTSVGVGAFYDLINVHKITLPQTMNLLSRNWISDFYSGEIFCSATMPPTGPFCEIPSDMIFYFSQTRVYIPIGTTEAYLTDFECGESWWSYFGADNLIESAEAASVVTVPQDSITANEATICVELIENAERYEIHLENEDDPSDTRDLLAYFDEDADKWVLEDLNKEELAPRKMPILHMDTVKRSIETLQIDITNLRPASNYSFTIIAKDKDAIMIGQKTGRFRTAPRNEETAFEDFTDEEMLKGKTLKIFYNDRIYIILNGEWFDITGHRVK